MNNCFLSSEVRCRIHSSDCLADYAHEATYHLGWYPGAGYRIASGGGLTNVGGLGYYWAATTVSAGPTPQYASYLYAYTGGVNPAMNSDRSNGFSVRCVAALLEWMNKAKELSKNINNNRLQQNTVMKPGRRTNTSVPCRNPRVIVISLMVCLYDKRLSVGQPFIFLIVCDRSILLELR